MKKILTVVFCIGVLVFASAELASADLINLTYNSSSEDYNPSLFEESIAWISSSDGVKNIKYWDGNEITQITNNTDADLDFVYVSLYNGTIAWNQHNDSEILDGSVLNDVYFFDGNNTNKIADTYNIAGVSNFDGKVAYSSYDGIYMWDGANTTQISNDRGLEISLYNNTAAWRFDYDIYYWNGSEVIKVADYDKYDYAAAVSLYDGQIAWHAKGGATNRWDIFYWDGNAVSNIANSWDNERYPSLYNGTIAWVGTYSDAIYYWDGTSTNTAYIHNNSISGPSLYDGRIAFAARSEPYNNTDIFYWDGGYIDTPYPPQNPVPEPTTMLLLGTGLVGVAGAARRKRKKNQA